MKRITRILVVVMLMAAMMASTAFAAGATITASAPETAKAGDTIKVTYSIKGNPGFEAYGMQIQYDKEAVELVSVKKGDVVAGEMQMFKGQTDATNAKVGTVVYASDEVAKADGSLFVATFKVKAGVVDKALTFGVTVDSIGTQADRFAVTTKSATTTVPAPEPVHKHDFGTKWLTNEKSHWHKCDCGEVADKADHSFGNWQTITEATETEDGLKARTCTVCGYEDTEVIKALDGTDETTVPETTPEEDGKDDSKQTGDEFNTLLFGAIAFAALMAAGGAVVVRRKNN